MTKEISKLCCDEAVSYRLTRMSPSGFRSLRCHYFGVQYAGGFRSWSCHNKCVVKTSECGNMYMTPNPKIVNTSNGDITSLNYNGKQLQDSSKFTQLSSGLGLPGVFSPSESETNDGT